MCLRAAQVCAEGTLARLQCLTIGTHWDTTQIRTDGDLLQGRSLLLLIHDCCACYSTPDSLPCSAFADREVPLHQLLLGSTSNDRPMRSDSATAGSLASLLHKRSMRPDPLQARSGSMVSLSASHGKTASMHAAWRCAISARQCMSSRMVEEADQHPRAH
jgi:hypothetical protein